MLQFLVLTIGVALANCQASPRVIETSYKNGKEYMYDYESQVLSGLPKGAKTWSGLKLKTDISMQTLSPMKVKFQMKTPRLYIVNDYLDSRDPTSEMLPMEYFKELLDDDVETMKLDLKKPLTFSYERGHVEDLVTEEDDPEWSVNIKRGVLSLLEMNFNERQSLSRDVPVLSGKQPMVFKVIEPSVVGECETRYMVESEKSKEDVPGMKVHKLRDHNRCVEKVIDSLDIMNGHSCDACDKMEKMDHITSQSSVRYNMLGSPDKFMILSAVSESKYSFMPYSQEFGVLSTYSNQTLTLVDSRPVSDQIRDPSSPLHHEQPLKVKRSEPESPSLTRRPLKLTRDEKKETMKMIEKALKGIEEMMTDRVDEELGEMLSELTRMLRSLDKPSLDSVLDIISGRKLPLARKVFWDVVPTLGTYPSLDLLFEELEKEDMSMVSKVMAMHWLSVLPKPDVFMVKRFMDFLEKTDIKEKIEHKLLRRSMWLALGSLGDKMIKVGTTAVKELENELKVIRELRSESNDRQVRKKLDRRHEEIGNKQIQMKELYTTTKKNIIKMVEKLHEMKDSDSKRLSMKVMSNLGYEEFTPMLESIIRSDEPEQTRIEAVISMYDTVKANPEMVEKIYLPLCLDRNQPEVIRMTAFSVVLFIERSRPALEMIVKSLEDEPNLNVGSYVYSTLMELSKLSTPCDDFKSLARNSSLAKRFSKKLPHMKSNFIARSSYNEKLKMGHTYMQAMQYSPDERSPAMFWAQYKTALLGKSTDLFDVLYSGHGLDHVLDQLIDVSKDTSLETLLKTVLHPRQKRHTTSENEQKIKDIKQKIGVKPRDSKQPEGFVAVRMFGHEILYMDTASLPSSPILSDPTARQSLLDSLKDKLSIVDGLKSILNSHKSWSLPLLRATIPTEMGLPLKIVVDNHAAFKLDGDITPKPYSRSSSMKSLISKMDASLKIRPSGLLEILGRMEVDMKYVRSGVSVKSKIHSDIPLDMKVSLDPKKYKLLIALQNEKELTTLKFESHTMTEIRRLPLTAEKYPIPPERKEITQLEDCDKKTVLYEFGKDVLGRNFKMVGIRNVPKDDSAPLPPVPDSIHFKYEPQTDSGLLIQVQHVTESDSDEPEPREKSSSRSSWGILSSWFSSSESSEELDSHERPSSHQPSSHSHSSESSEVSDTIDLEESDLTLDYLKDKLRSSASILDSGIKCGMVLRIADSDPEPKHEVQLSTLYQKDQSSRKISYTVELRRRPKPDEEKPWKMVADMKLDIPPRHVEPSDLWDNEYQKQIQQQIKLSVSENGQQIDSLLDLGSDSLKKAMKQLKKLEQPDSLHEILEKVLNHVAQNSVDSDTRKLTAIVHKQRKLLKDATRLSKQPTDPKKISDHLEKLQNLLEKSKDVTDKVSVALSKTPRGHQQPDDAVKVLYILSTKDKTKNRIKKTVEKLQPVLTLDEKKDLDTKLREHDEDLERIKSQQRQHSLDKQPTEQQKSTLEVDPNDRSLHSKLLDVEQKLISLSASKARDFRRESLTETKLESHKHHVEDILDSSRDIKEKVDSVLLHRSKLDRMLRVKLVEVLLYSKLTTSDIEKDIKALEKKVKSSDLSSIRIPQDDSMETRRKELVKQKEDLTKEAKDIAKRLIISIDVVKERTSVSSHESPIGSDQLDTLTKVQIKQLKVLEDLKKKSPSKSVDSDDKPISKELIQDHLDTLKEAGKTIKEIVEQESDEIKQEKEPLLCPVIVKTLKVLSKQHEVLSILQKVVDEKIIKKSVSDDSTLHKYRELKKKVETLKEDTIKQIKKAQKLVKKVPISDLEPTYSDLSSVIPSNDLPVPVTVLLKRLMKVEVKHSELRPLQDKLSKSVKHPDPRDRPSHTSESVHHKQLLYDIISKLMASQDELDKIQEPLEHIVREEPDNERVSELLKKVTEKQENQLKHVKAVEKVLIDRSRSDLSLVQPLQTIQRLKDRVQRQQHKTKLLPRPQDTKDRSSPRTPGRSSSLSHYDDESRSRSPGRLLNRDITGIATIQYGVEDQQKKTITLRLFGKKSLQQLLWEHDQSLPSKQDRTVQEYLSDRLEPNDPTASRYSIVKDKLNTYRHLHVLVAYEDSLPVPVRELLWKLHESMKMMYHTKVQLMWPDSTNYKNKIEITTELQTDDKWIDVEIKTPYETTLFKNIPAPDMMKYMSLSDSTPHTLLSTMSTRHLPATCEVTPDRVKLYKGKTIEVDLKTHPCESVLTMDCSPHSSLAVTSKPHPQDPSKKVITVLTKSRMVEIKPDPSIVKVKVDGEPVPLPPYPDSLKVASESKEPVIVKKLRDDQVEVKLPHVGLSLVTDGKTVSLKVPQTYWSKLCGVCGSLDDYRPSKLKGPQGVKYSDPLPYTATYLVPDRECDPEPIHSQLRVPEIRAKSKQVSPLEETKVIETTINRLHKVCFSISPVKRCPPDSKAEGVKDHLVPFHCLRSSSSKVEIYRHLAESRALYELRDRSPDMHKTVPTPKICVKP